MSSEEQPPTQAPPQEEGGQENPPAPIAPVAEVVALPIQTAAPPAETPASLPTEEVHFDGTFSAPAPEATVADPVPEKAVAPETAAPPPTPVQASTPVPAPAPAPVPEMATASAGDVIPQELHHHLYRAKALSERLLSVMAQREERLAEIKRRVALLEPGGESVQPLIEAENNMRDAHTRMKSVLVDLGKELEHAGVTQLPPSDTQLTDLPSHDGQSDEVAFLYKNLLLALGEWKGAQKKQAAQRAEELAKQVAALREQVAREHAETQRIRQRKEHLEQLRQEKQVELDNIKKEPDGANEHKE